MKLNRTEYRDKVLACWLGKNIGGTLGAPFEWQRQVNKVSFYTQDLGGEPMPNDDLDIQLLWLVAMEERGVDLDANDLAEYWTLYVTPHWSEYGIGKTNMRMGLQPPLCGTLNNPYKDSCGAFIRSEIWACVAPGSPQVAAAYAYNDAILDHGNGEGTYAEVFVAALESAAFVISDLRKLIDIALSYIPESCGVAGAVNLAVECYESGKSWLEARNLILEKHRGRLAWATISKEDLERGFDTGQVGYDVPSNIGMLLIGLLYGEGDFAKSLCTAVNCGEDTDCTGATAGSIFGILHGTKGIPEEWIAPIGRSIKTVSLNLGELGYFGNQLALDVDTLTARTDRMQQQVALRKPLRLEVGDAETDLTDVNPDSFYVGSKWRMAFYANLDAPVYRFLDFDVAVDYGKEGPAISTGEARTIKLRITNKYKTMANLNVQWYAPDDWTITPPNGLIFSWNTMGVAEAEFSVEVDDLVEPVARAVIEITSPGRPTTMLVPVTFVNGSLL